MGQAEVIVAALAVFLGWSGGAAARAGETGPRHLIYLHGRIIQDQ